jgi:ABC-type transport system involved in multi-copper enzyme maturation permease subunit
MNLLNAVYYSIKPIFHTLIFEIKLQIKKFIIFSVITFALLFLDSYINYFLNQPLPSSQASYYQFGTTYFLIIIVLVVSFFFGGIICSEFKDKTGLEILPLTSRLKLVIGKYLANVVLITGIIGVQYSSMALFAYNFYGGPLLNTLLYSFSLAILYALAIGSITIFLSSFLPSKTLVIIIIVGYILIGDLIINSLIITSTSEGIEPLYSLTYIFQIVTYSLYPDFSTMERRTLDGSWLFPSLEGALILLSLYIVFFFILGALLFKHREF